MSYFSLAPFRLSGKVYELAKFLNRSLRSVQRRKGALRAGFLGAQEGEGSSGTNRAKGSLRKDGLRGGRLGAGPSPRSGGEAAGAAGEGPSTGRGTPVVGEDVASLLYAILGEQRLEKYFCLRWIISNKLCIFTCIPGLAGIPIKEIKNSPRRFYCGVIGTFTQ